MSRTKKAAILSMQKVVNYGSFLQAVALRNLLYGSGASEVNFLDIGTGRRLEGFAQDGMAQRIGRIACSVLDGSLLRKYRNSRYYKWLREEFTAKYHPLLAHPNDGHHRYDVAVIGSDEVFNCCQAAPWGYTPRLYGDIPEADSVISYAASFSSTTYEQLEQHGIADEIAANLSRLSAISVRDRHSAEIVERLTGRIPLLHVDPVLAYGFGTETAQLTTDLRDTMIVYSYPYRFSGEEARQTVEFARRHGKKLVSVMAYYQWCDQILRPANPVELLACFRDADYVVSDTFHGAVFSMLTGSNFCTFVRESNRNKLGGLLQQFGLTDRIVTAGNTLSNVLARQPDYREFNAVLAVERQRTFEYLKAGLELHGQS